MRFLVLALVLTTSAMGCQAFKTNATSLSSIVYSPSPVTSTPVSTTFLYRVGPSVDFLHYCSVDPATGDFAEHPAVALPAGSQPSGLAITPNKEHLYVGYRGADKIVHYTLDQVTGLPTYSSEFPTLGGDIRKLLMDPTGRFMWSLQYDQIVSYTIHAVTGVLSWQGTFGITGGLTITTDSAGTHLYVSATGTGTNSYDINQATGLLSNGGILSGTISNALKLNSAGTRLYGVRYGNSEGYRFDRNVVTGVITYNNTVATPAIFPYYDLIFNAASSHVYFLNNFQRRIDSFSVNAGTGALTFVNSADLPSGCVPESMTLISTESHLFTSCMDGSGRTLSVKINVDGSLDAASLKTSIATGLSANTVISVTY
ncbi:MAG: beta-propeller fold lactonase family protein [Bdellovibrionota bacterium]